MTTPLLTPTYTIGAWSTNVVTADGTRWVVTEQDLFDGPGVKLRVTERPAGPGAYRLRSHRAARTATLSGWCDAPGDATADTVRAQLLGLFADGGQAQLVLDDGRRPRFLTVELADKVKVVPAGAFFDWQLPLLANDPRWYDTTLQSGSSAPQSTTSDGLDWADNSSPGLTGVDWAATDGTNTGLDWGSQQSSGAITMTNTGNTSTWPVFTLYGPLVAPRIIASASGAVIAYSLTIAAGDWLTIDCSPFTRRVLLNDSADRFSALSSAQWISIPAGSSETVTLGASGAGYLSAQWRSANY